jgi:hypothetical protein
MNRKGNPNNRNLYKGNLGQGKLCKGKLGRSIHEEQ